MSRPPPPAHAPDAVHALVAGHYERPDLERAILDALASASKDPDRLTAADLAPVDEFHTGGRPATLEFAQAIGATQDMHLLDVGSGIGGPSRVFASRYGCRVTGIDLTEDYVRTATALAARVGLGDLVAYRHASAVDLPFAPGSFDGAYMMHVGMNIQDKAALCREVRRVLRPAGVFAIYDLMRTGEGDVRFPVPWAATAATSFLADPGEYRRALVQAGFAVVGERNRRDFVLDQFSRIAAREAQDDAHGEVRPLGIHILMKSDAAEKRGNVRHAIEAGVIAPVEMICRRNASSA